MFHLSHRTLALVTITPAMSLALAACGSPAINTNYTPGAQPTSQSTMTGAPTHGATAKASKSAGAKSTSHATAGATSKSGTSTSGQTSAPSGSRTTSGGSGGTHTVGPSSAAITVVPSTGLTNGQTVTIHGTHFKPGVSIIIVECVDKGANTQQTNCTGGSGLFGIPAGFRPAADGTFTRKFVVHKSFSGIGGGYNTCSSSSPCIISVTEPTNNPTEEADAHIYFR